MCNNFTLILLSVSVVSVCVAMCVCGCHTGAAEPVWWLQTFI